MNTVSFKKSVHPSGPVAQRITRLTTDQKIAGSNPAWVAAKLFDFFFRFEQKKFMRPRVGSNHQPFG